MLRRNQRSEYIAQRRKGRKEKNDSELGVLGVLAEQISVFMRYGQVRTGASRAHRLEG